MRYEVTYYDSFDTIIQGILYAESEEEAKEYANIMHDEFLRLHKLYDKYNAYDGITNIYSINENAGQGPIKVEADIIHLLKDAKDWYGQYGSTNIAFGSVTEIWSDYRDGHEVSQDSMDAAADHHNHDHEEATEEGHDHEHEANSPSLPPMADLKAANEHTNIEDVIIDEENQTVEIKDPDLRLDVGAVAKGYATEKVAKKLIESGMEAGLISAGGNVRIIGNPPENDKDYFAVGLQNPDAVMSMDPSNENMIDTVYANNTSIVTSGDYQRFYIVDGKSYHHLIDPTTLMPADHFRAVSIMAEDSGLSDFLSTAAFCLPYEKSKALIESIDGVEGYWIHKDGTVTFTEGMAKHLKSQGATNRG